MLDGLPLSIDASRTFVVSAWANERVGIAGVIAVGGSAAGKAFGSAMKPLT